MAMQPRRLAKLGLALLGCVAILTTARPAAAGLLAQDRPAIAVWRSSPNPLFGIPPQGKQFNPMVIGVFARTTTGRLILRRWGGTAWNWVDHGLPPKTSLACAPAAVAWRFGDAEIINVFACGADGTLVERRYTNFGFGGWTWVRHEAPAGVSVKSPGSVVHWRNDAGVNQLSFFFVGTDGNLHERLLNGTTWSWKNHGRPYWACRQGEAPAVVTWEPGRSPVSVFLRDEGKTVTERRVVGGKGVWIEHPMTAGPFVLSIESIPAAIAWRPPGAAVSLQVFAVSGYDAHFYALSGDDTWLEWNDHGFPPSAIDEYAAAVAAWPAGPMSIRLNLFARDFDGNLIERWFDGTAWYWSDHGKPPSTYLGEAAPAIVTWRAGAVTRLNLFAVGLDGSLIEYWWNGEGWSWTEHKFPPFP